MSDTDKTGRDPGRIPREAPEPSLSEASGEGFLTDSPAPSRPAHPLKTWIDGRPPLYEVSAKEREDDRRRDRAEFDEDYFAEDPFGRFIQEILDGKAPFGSA